MNRLQVELRSQQANFLQKTADNEYISLSKALGGIIGRYGHDTLSTYRKAAKKVRFHFVIHPDHLALLDMISVKAGLFRSDVIRRLIDRAAERD
jgi:hypothetical protein